TVSDRRHEPRLVARAAAGGQICADAHQPAHKGRRDGHAPKTIEEYVGRVNTATGSVSTARMISPTGRCRTAVDPTGVSFGSQRDSTVSAGAGQPTYWELPTLLACSTRDRQRPV